MHLCALLPLLLLPTTQPSPFVIANPAGPARVDYLIVAADDYVTACDPLLTLRKTQGLEVGLTSLTEACAATGQALGAPALIAFLRHAHDDWGTRYVLLVGAAIGAPGQVIPMSLERARYYSPDFVSSPDLATDFAYSALGDGAPVLHVGRFPARSLAEARVMVAKTVAYETALKPGLWQRRISFLAGQPALNPLVDAAIESLFGQVVSQDIPEGYDVEVAYAEPKSSYCPSPSRFHQNAVRLINQGSLLCAYVGHGMRTGFDDLRWQGRSFPILGSEDLGEIDASAGPPVMAVIACWTGQLDSPAGPCVAEGLLKLPGGPVALLASSRICQPYGNALLGKALVGSLLGRPQARLGDALDEARTRLLATEQDAFRRQVDTLAGLVQGPQSLPGIRADTARHYNLLGDPALALQRPALSLELKVTRDDTGHLAVTGESPLESANVVVSAECPRDQLARALEALPEETSSNFEAAMNRRYVSANDKAYVRAEAKLEGGHLRVELTLPAGVKAPVIVKAFAWSAAASAMGATQAAVAGPPSR